jgi:hypothetical protein
MQSDDEDTSGQSDAQVEESEQEQQQGGPPVCGGCGQDLVDIYFTAGEMAICGQCGDAIIERQTGGSGGRRFFKALGWGLLAAVAGSLIWFAVRRLTGYEIGLVAIVVGLMIGAAVRRGSDARGGWAYQTLAILLTYLAIGGQYAPDVAQVIREDRYQQVAVVDQAPGAGEQASTGQQDAPAADAQEPVAGLAGEQTAPGAALAAVLLAILIIVIALISPILVAFNSIFGFLIIAFALYEAWKLNKRVHIDIAGPYELETEPEPAPEPAPAG